jgi:hypothetical protein
MKMILLIEYNSNFNYFKLQWLKSGDLPGTGWLF